MDLIFGGYSIWDYIGCFFSFIPKFMYLLYAALASALDALQCLIRRLVGLDVYYVGGNPVYNEDPVMNFIFGILGIGDNKATYSVLSTVFWSLAIFGVIVLALTTIVAIIKSHYQEDAAKTSPMGYIFTAVKSILTFAIVPFVTIVGFWLSTFLLTTLDGITAGRATNESLQGIYGSNQISKLIEQDAGGRKTYSRYDFFGIGAGSTSTTFSGMLFNSAAYSSNRVRTGQFTENNFADLGLFGAYIPSGEEWQEWTAYQIDYAFANNLAIQGGMHMTDVYDSTSILLTIQSIDVFWIGWTEGFSKYNVDVVFYYYNLWTFNFMIGFISVIVCAGLMFSITLGVMTRLIKSVALFLIYPGVLGLAPLDEFGGFKKWRTEFTQQILMAFGSIIGMNVFFLIFPYLSELKFFNFGLLDYMVNIVIVVAGLSMIKGFVGFMSGLIGGGDALATGEGIKGEVKGNLLKGATMTAGAAGFAMKAFKFGTPAGAALGALKKKYAGHVANRLGDKAAKNLAGAAEGDAINAAAEDRVRVATVENQEMEQEWLNSDAGRAARTRGLEDAKRRGFRGEEAEKMADEYALKEAQADLEAHTPDYITNKRIVEAEGYLSSADKNKGAEARRLHAEAESMTDRQKMILQSNYLEMGEVKGDDGTIKQKAVNIPHGKRQAIANAGRELLGAIQKQFFDTLPKNLGINLGSLAGIFKAGTLAKSEGEGQYGEVLSAMTQDQLNERKAAKPIRRAAVRDSIAGAIFGMNKAGPKEAAKASGEKAQLEAADKSAKSAEAMLKVTEELAKVSKEMSKAAADLKSSGGSGRGGSGSGS